MTRVEWPTPEARATAVRFMNSEMKLIAETKGSYQLHLGRKNYQLHFRLKAQMRLLFPCDSCTPLEFLFQTEFQADTSLDVELFASRKGLLRLPQ